MRKGLLLNLDQSLSVTLNDIANIPFKLILNKLGDQRVYDIRITTTAYTAMCVDLFNPDQVTNADRLSITKYVNAEGLLGQYELYLEVDNIVYPLHQSVTFQ